MKTNLMRRARAAAAICIDLLGGPLGWDVMVCRTSDLPGIDWFVVRRRPAGEPRARLPGQIQPS